MLRSMPRKCSKCGKSLAGRSSLARYCSDACRLAALSARRRRTKRCGYCGATFKAKRSDAVYCSAACRVSALRARKGPRQAAPRAGYSAERAAATGGLGKVDKARRLVADKRAGRKGKADA